MGIIVRNMNMANFSHVRLGNVGKRKIYPESWFNVFMFNNNNQIYRGTYSGVKNLSSIGVQITDNKDNIPVINYSGRDSSTATGIVNYKIPINAKIYFELSGRAASAGGLTNAISISLGLTNHNSTISTYSSAFNNTGSTVGICLDTIEGRIYLWNGNTMRSWHSGFNVDSLGDNRHLAIRSHQTNSTYSPGNLQYKMREDDYLFSIPYGYEPAFIDSDDI